jgi:LemA protein
MERNAMKLRYLLAIAAVALVVLSPFAFGKYNAIVDLDEVWQKDNGIVNTAMQRQADLLPNLARTAQAYMNGEQKTYVGVAVGRAGKAVEEAKAATPGTADGAAKQAAAVVAGQQAMVAINAVREAYPEMKSNKNFETLMSQNRITDARRRLQLTTVPFNKEVRKFPGTIYARLFGFAPKEYFEADAAGKVAPVLDFK